MQINVTAHIEYWQQQSPVRIENAIYAPDLAIEFEGYGQRIPGKLSKVPDGHGYNFVVADEAKAKITIGGKPCKLKQLHFHARSEHYLGDLDSALEIHLIHEIPDREPGSRNVVVGVLLNPVPGGPKIKGLARLNELFRSHALPDFDESAVAANAEDFDARGFIPTKPYRFYRYEGSLTTYPYSEVISWVVMADLLSVDASSINEIVKKSTHDARPLQPLNRRFILKNFAK